MEKTVASDDLSLAMVAKDFLQHHVADNVEALNDLDPDEAAAVLTHLPLDRAVEILDQPELDTVPDIFERLPAESAVRLLSGMAADRAADLFRRLLDPQREELLGRLDPETRNSIEQLLAYPANTAGSLMTTEFVSVPNTWTVRQTLDHIRVVERTRETIYAIFVLDPRTRRLLQSIPLRRLISADPDAPILSAARPYPPITVTALTDREEVARLFRKYDLLAVAVVDNVGHLLGIVTVDDAIDAMLQESNEDVQKFGGMEAIDEPYLDISFAANDPQTRRLALRAFPQRNADSKRVATFRDGA